MEWPCSSSSSLSATTVLLLELLLKPVTLVIRDLAGTIFFLTTAMFSLDAEVGKTEEFSEVFGRHDSIGSGRGDRGGVGMLKMGVFGPCF